MESLDKFIKNGYDYSMEKVAKFELVSQKQFTEGYLDCFPSAKEGDALAAYRALRLPRRATAGSAGYDFFTTADVLLRPGGDGEDSHRNPRPHCGRMVFGDFSAERAGL